MTEKLNDAMNQIVVLTGKTADAEARISAKDERIQELKTEINNLKNEHMAELTLLKQSIHGMPSKR